MIYHDLPGIETKVSAISLGTAQYGSQLDEAASFALLDRFAELGGTFLDSAHIYGAWDSSGANGGCGNSEVVIGRWMKARGNRDAMVVGTKGGHPDFTTKASGMTAEMVQRHLTESLEHLQVDSIDIYWFHRDDRSIPVAEILGWVAEPCREGRIRAIGCSHWRVDRMAEALRVAGEAGLPLLRANQVAWSLAEARVKQSDGPFGEQLAMGEAMHAFHRRTGLAAAGYQSQAGGFFAAKYDDLDFGADDFPKPGLARRYGSEENLRRRAVAREIARQRGCSTNQVALAWLIRQPFPSFAIAGPGNVEQLEDTMGAAEISLTSEEMAALSGGGR